MNEILLNRINKIKKHQTSTEVFYDFLCVYYDDYIDVLNESEDAPYPKELTLPLKDRESGIYDAVTWLVEQGYNVNRGDCFNPLMMAVGHADAPMTSFLLQHGADANYWPEMDKSSEPLHDNYYLEDIDIAYLNETWPKSERYIDALLQTAKVLLQEGNTGSFFGICLVADAEKREIILSDCHYKY